VKAAVLLVARRGRQVGAALRVEVRRIRGLARLLAQLARGVEHPAVVEAQKVLGHTRALAAHRGAAVRAGVHERVDAPVGVAVENQAPTRHGARDELPRFGNLGGVAQVEPAAVENRLALGRHDVRIDERGARHLE
jgi:hypothetical protein